MQWGCISMVVHIYGHLLLKAALKRSSNCTTKSKAGDLKSLEESAKIIKVLQKAFQRQVTAQESDQGRFYHSLSFSLNVNYSKMKVLLESTFRNTAYISIRNDTPTVFFIFRWAVQCSGRVVGFCLRQARCKAWCERYPFVSQCKDANAQNAKSLEVWSNSEGKQIHK